MLLRLFKKILLCVLLLAPLSLTAKPINQLIVFGDSLSDNGNLAGVAALNPQYAYYNFLNQPPYYHGFTNGLTAVEQLAQLMNISLLPSYQYGSNYAVAGARAAGTTVIDLSAQVAAFLASQHGAIPVDALYIIFIGGNDIRDMRDQSDTIAATILTTASNNIQNTLGQLRNAGAKHFLVINAADNGAIPETRLLAASSPINLIQRGRQKTQAFNHNLDAIVESAEKLSGVDIELFDLNGFFDGILKHAQKYQFIDATNACYSSVYFQYYPVCNSSKMDSFVFFDEIHPTQPVHKLVANALLSEIKRDHRDLNCK